MSRRKLDADRVRLRRCSDFNRSRRDRTERADDFRKYCDPSADHNGAFSVPDDLDRRGCESTEKELGFPVYTKPANLGSSIGVSRAENREELRSALELAFEYDRRVLVEKGLTRPIELNCSVMGYDGDVTASPLEMPVSGDEFLTYREKYLASGGSKGMASLHRVLPAPVEDELRDQIQEMSKKIFTMMDCKGVVRIDYMFDRDSGNFFITEINTIPGSLAFYLWENAGIPYRRLIDQMVSLAEKAHQDKNQASYAYTSNILEGAVLGAKGAKGSKGSKA